MIVPHLCFKFATFYQFSSTYLLGFIGVVKLLLSFKILYEF